MTINYFEEGEPQNRLNSLTSIFQDLQNEIALLADELDSDTLEEAEDNIDAVIQKLGDVLRRTDGKWNNV